MKIVSWNIAGRDEPWRWLATSDVDFALLQEARPPPADIADHFRADEGGWETAGADKNRKWRTAVVHVSGKHEFRPFVAKPIAEAIGEQLAVSRYGTLSAARVSGPSGHEVIIASMYAPWENPNRSTGSHWIMSDSSAHRIISDLATLIGRERGHQLLAAGDLNALYGYGEHGSTYWAGRYQSIFDRCEAIGIPFIGPQAPNGVQAEPWPKELPPGSRNVPTYHHSKQTQATATRQLDFVFASHALAPRVSVSAQNRPEDWGPSDHCRVVIDLAI